ncbi:MAG: type IV toxin-antitoxin system AbiEi family antitoxin domain-containing protein [Acidimicrobiia bacterium]
MTDDALARLGRLAEGQHGLVTLAQLREIGVRPKTLDRIITSGQLVRVAPRVLLVHGAPASWQRRIQAERLSAGDDAVVSHRSAAALYDLDGFDSHRTVHLTVPLHRQKRRRTDVTIHRSPDYELIRPDTRQGIPVTDVARLVLDLYAGEPNAEVARRGLFSARKKKLVSWTELHETLEAHARHGRRGITRLRADLDLYSRIGCPETTFEDAIRRLLMEAGLPEPELQHPVVAGSGYRIDVAYPELRVGIEGKSKAHHLTDLAFETDSVRDADLAIAGWILIHVTWAQIHRDPAGVVRRVRRALSRREGVAA